MRDLINLIETAQGGLVEGPVVDGRIVPRLADGTPPTVLYRIMSGAEYDAGIHAGHFVSRDGRVHADVTPHFEYCEPGSDNALVAIQYDDADGWKAKWSSMGCVAITSEPIPANKVRLISRGSRRDLEGASLMESEIAGVPEDVVERYSYGDCMWLALALNKRFGWPIYAQMHRDAEHGDYVAHAFCKMPDGRECDILGPQDRVDIWTDDVQPWDPEELLQTMENDPHNSPQAARKLADANDAIDRYILPKLG